MTKTKSLAVASLLLLGALPAAAAPAVVTLSFDDTFADQLQVGPLLAARGLHATFFVNSPRIDQDGYMTNDQLLSLQAAGNEIAGHTANHMALSTIPADEQRRQICDDRVALLGRGFNVANFAYPHGAGDLATHQIVTDCGYNAARDLASLRSHDPETCSPCAYAETMPPQDALSIRTPVSVKSNITLADLQLSVTDAEAHGGGWVPFVFHHVCDGCNTLAISPAVLTQFLDWLAARSGTTGTTVKTFQDVIAGPLNAGVPGPAPTQFVDTDGNLLRNASLETDADGDLVPDCWQLSPGGAGAASYTAGRASEAHSGTGAELITVTGMPASSPRIVTFQDLGYCAPVATSGHTYKLSAWYQASGPAVLLAYYRTSTGAWKYWTKSPALPASAAYVLGEWTTPALPADAKGLSVGIALTTAGTLAADDLRLTDTAGPPVTPPDTTGADAGAPSGDNPDLGSSTPPPTMTDNGGCAFVAGAQGQVYLAAALLGLLLLAAAPRRRRR